MCKMCAAGVWQKSVKTRKKVFLSHVLPQAHLFATACCNSHALSTWVPASEAAWRGKARCSGLFTTGALEARPQRGCWRGLDMRAAFCWETARRCREPTVCVWGELRVRPSLNVTKSGIFSFKVSHPYVCRIGLHLSRLVFLWVHCACFICGNLKDLKEPKKWKFSIQQQNVAEFT